jgi:hypothetical protein
MKMKNNKHIQSFNEHQENLNISDVSESKLNIEEVKKDIETKWSNSGRKCKLVDFYEDQISNYEDRMKKSDYEMLRDMIIFDWGDLDNDIVPEYI